MLVPPRSSASTPFGRGAGSVERSWPPVLAHADDDAVPCHLETPFPPHARVLYDARTRGDQRAPPRSRSTAGFLHIPSGPKNGVPSTPRCADLASIDPLSLPSRARRAVSASRF